MSSSLSVFLFCQNLLYRKRAHGSFLSFRIYTKYTDSIDTFMQVPYHMNEVNHKVIENGMLNLFDEIQRDRFFVGVLESHSNSIYSFSYGTANGEYYGARRNEN